MHEPNWQLFNHSIEQLVAAGTGLAALMSTDAMATLAKPHTVEAGKAASMERSALPIAVRVRKVNEPEITSRAQQQILPAAAVYELATELRDRGWQFVQVLSNLPSLFQRCLGVPADRDWPSLKTITPLSSGKSLCIICGPEQGLLLFGESARLVAIAYHVHVELVFHEINGAQCLHLITSSLLDPEA